MIKFLSLAGILYGWYINRVWKKYRKELPQQSELIQDKTSCKFVHLIVPMGNMNHNYMQIYNPVIQQEVQ